MPNLEERIVMLRRRAATRREKAANLAAARKLTAAAEADETLAANLEVNHLKLEADKARKAISHAKIVIGAGVLLLPANSCASTLAGILPLLTERDQKWLNKWFAEKEIDFAGPVIAGNSNAASAPVDPASTSETAGGAIGKALQRTIDGMTEGELGLLLPDILGHANDEDRAVLDAWLGKRNPLHA